MNYKAHCLTACARAFPLALVLIVGANCRRCEAAYSDAVLADNPIAYWRLDETTGNTAVNAGSLGASANAQYASSHTKGTPPLVTGPGASVVFSGGQVSLSNVNGLNTGGPFTQKSVELWFRANTLTGRQVLYEQGGGTRGLNIYLDGADLYVAGWNRANDDGGAAAAPWGATNPVFASLLGVVATDTTYHVVLVMDGDASGTNGTISGFLNGVRFGQQSGVGRLWNHNPAVIANAASGTRFHDNNTSTSNRDFDGRIDEVALYNTALTETQILAHYQEGIGATGLVGHWPFDEGAGITAADNAPLANDATLQNGAGWTTDCASRNAIAFDGLDDVAATGSPFQPPSVGTVAFWMRSSGAATTRERLFGVNGDWEARREPDGTIVFDLGASPPANNQPFRTANTFPTADRWHHVAVVFDDSDDTFEIWIDGQLDASGVNSANMIPQSAGTLSFGARTGSSENWNGALRDFRVYSIKLSPAQIAELYGILAHWEFNETNGTVAVDISGRGADAEYLGGPVLGVPGAYPPTTDTAVLLNGASQSISANQSLLNDAPEFTLSGWFRPTSVSPVQSFFGQRDLIEVGLNGGANQLELWTAASGAVSASNAMTPGRWSHVAAVGTGASLILYVDGQVASMGGSSVANYGSNAETFLIGGGVFETAGDNFDGRVDDVRVYKRALCPDEIAALHSSGRAKGVRVIQWIEVK